MLTAREINRTETYYYRTNGQQYSAPQQVRHSSSNLSGRIPDIYGHSWGDAVDLLHDLASKHGTVVKIVLNRSEAYPGLLIFVIYFDHINAAEDCYKYLQTVATLQQVSKFQSLMHVQTPCVQASSTH